MLFHVLIVGRLCNRPNFLGYAGDALIVSRPLTVWKYAIFGGHGKERNLNLR